MRKAIGSRLNLAALISAGLLGGLIAVGVMSLTLGQTGTTAAAPARANTIAADSERQIIAAVQKVGPAVVNIKTALKAPPPQFPFFEQPLPPEGQASGVIIDSRGYVLTNNHVLAGAQDVQITLADGRVFDHAKIVGTDPLSDIGVAQISGKNLPVAQLGDSTQKPIGSWVIAIGNPFGYQNTVTVGVLSARNRSLQAPTGAGLEGLLQTDAAINPGNSGGALVDIEGKVIGIPTAIVPYAQGIGFAIAAEAARKVVDELIATGRVTHPWLGVQFLARITEDVQKELKLPNRRGAAVWSVQPGSPADQAGLLRADVVLKISGRDVVGPDDIVKAVRASKVGEKLALVVRREGKEVSVTVVLAQQPPPSPADSE